MGYKVLGTLKYNDEVFEHGESVSASDVGGEDNFNEIVASKGVVTDEEFKQLYPEQEGTVTDPTGTPSNLREVEGTKLQQNPPEEPRQSDESNPTPHNPADPPVVKGAGDTTKAAKTAESGKSSDEKK